MIFLMSILMWLAVLSLIVFAILWIVFGIKKSKKVKIGMLGTIISAAAFVLFLLTSSAIISDGNRDNSSTDSSDNQSSASYDSSSSSDKENETKTIEDKKFTDKVANGDLASMSLDGYKVEKIENDSDANKTNAEYNLDSVGVPYYRVTYKFTITSNWDKTADLSFTQLSFTDPNGATRTDGKSGDANSEMYSTFSDGVIHPNGKKTFTVVYLVSDKPEDTNILPITLDADSFVVQGTSETASDPMTWEFK